MQKKSNHLTTSNTTGLENQRQTGKTKKKKKDRAERKKERKEGDRIKN